MSNELRSTGRTQRGVVQALCTMLRGAKVVHVSADAQTAKDCASYAGYWLQDNGFMQQSTVPCVVQGLEVTFGTARLTFTDACPITDGLVVEVFKDHYLLELEAVEQAQAERVQATQDIIELMIRHGLAAQDIVSEQL